jgi:hypothetical protein
MKSQLCQIMNWAYGNLGQVTAGKSCWQNGTPVAGQSLEYASDDIGGRKTAGRDGDHECVRLSGTPSPLQGWGDLAERWGSGFRVNASPIRVAAFVETLPSSRLPAQCHP